jgi:hypothetical protein
MKTFDTGTSAGEQELAEAQELQLLLRGESWIRVSGPLVTLYNDDPGRIRPVPR